MKTTRTSVVRRGARPLARLLPAGLLLGALAFGCGRGATPSGTTEDDPARAAEVRAASVAWDSAYNAGEVAALVELYADSAVSMPYDRPALAGRTAIADDFRALFHDYRGEHHTEVLALEVTGDWAIERGRYTLATTPRDGGTIVSEEGKHVVVRHRVDGAWKIHWEIWNTDQPRTP
jgi:ketosteroid isomerase-like protein